MADRRVKVLVEAEIGNYRKGMQEAGKATEGLAKSTDSAAKGTEQMGKSAAAAGKHADGLRGKLSQLADENSKVGKAAQDIVPALAGIGAVGAAGFVKAASTAASFDKAMSGVQAATHETAQNMELLSEAAIRAGADTAYSAEEAAGAIEELAKAGVSTADILAGGLDGALALAAAGELEVADAAEIAASAMVQFGLEGSKIPHIADLLAAGAGKAQGSVQDLGMGLSQVGLVANSTGLTIEETVGGLSAFASAGLMGSDAGTSFKSMLQRLNPQSEEAANLMEELGLSAYDSSGEFIGLSEYAGLLQEKLSGMSSEQRNAAMQTLFGADAVRAANVLYEQGAEGIEEWEAAVNDAGYAAETAAIMQDNLAGDLEKLGGAFDTAFLKAGTGANEVLREIVQGAESLVDAIGQLPAPVLQAGAVMSGLVGVAGLAGAAFITIVPKIKETKDALSVLAPAGGKADKAMRGVGKAAGLASAAFIGFEILKGIANDAVPAAAGLESVANALMSVAESGDMAALDEVFARGGEELNGFVDAVNLLDPSTLNAHMESFGESVLGLRTETAQAREQMVELDQVLATMDAETAAEQMNRLREELEASGNYDMSSWEGLKRLFPEYAASVEAAANATGQATSEADLFQAAMGNLPPHMQAAAAGMEATGDAADGAVPGLDAAGGALDETAVEAEALADALDVALDGLREMGAVPRNAQAASDAYQQSLMDLTQAVKDNGATLDENTEKGLANRAALRSHTEAGLENAAAMAEAGASQGEISASLMGMYESLVQSAQAMGLSATEAELYAKDLLDIPTDIDVDVQSEMDTRALEIAELTGQVIDGIPDGVVVLSQMDTKAADQAFRTAESIKAIPGYKYVDVAVDDKGTPGQIQERINQVSGKTEYVFVDDNNTISNVQQRIVNIDGKDVPVYVKDDGTVVITQSKIKGIQGKNVDIIAQAKTADAETKLNNAARPRYVSIVASVTGNTSLPPVSIRRPGLGGYTGGVVGQDFGLPRLASGGRLPYYGLGTDAIVGIGSHGAPTALVDDGEWVIRERSARKYDRLLGLINGDHPSVQHLAGYANGGSVGREWSAQSVAAAPVVNVSAPSGSVVDPAAIGSAVRAALDGAKVVMDGPRLVGALRMVKTR